MKTPAKKPTIEDLSAQVAALQAELQTLVGAVRNGFAASESPLQSEGTQPRMVPSSPMKPRVPLHRLRARPREGLTVAQRIIEALQFEPMTIEQIADRFGMPLHEAMSFLYREQGAGRIHNVSDDDTPRWFASLGDDCPNQELRAAILGLLLYRPMTFPEMSTATGARKARLSGELTSLEKRYEWVENTSGDVRRKRYGIRDEVRDAVITELGLG